MCCVWLFCVVRGCRSLCVGVVYCSLLVVVCFVVDLMSLRCVLFVVCGLLDLLACAMFGSLCAVRC